jgi:hypothetical protein
VAGVGYVPPSDEEDGLRAPSAVLIFAPVLLALVVLFFSLTNWSVHLAFEERAPGTWLSLGIIFGALLLVLPAIRKPSLGAAKRRAAGLLSLVLVAALLDERLQWHERLGGRIFDLVDKQAYPWVVQADDVMIILLAFLGTAFLWRLIRVLPDARDYLPYLGVIAFVALAHGVFDLLDHREYIWQIFWPDATFGSLRPLRNVLGFFEEAMKLWTEYFVVLLFLRLFYREPGHLLWATLVMVGSFMATAGLWSLVNNPIVPYMILGGRLHFFRNYPLFLPFAFVWFAWTLVVWRWFRADAEVTALAGLFFLWPFVQAPAWLAVVFGGVLGLALRRGWRLPTRARGALIAGLIVTFGVAMGLSQRSYLSQRRFLPLESIPFETGRQIILESDR